MTIEFETALKKDWNLVKSRKSFINQVATAIQPLSGACPTDKAAGHGKRAILHALAHVFYSENEDTKKCETVRYYSVDKYGTSDAVALLRTRMEETVKLLHDATDEETMKQIHREHFAKAGFAILSVRLHMPPSADGAYRDYLERLNLAAERNLYAGHLCSNKILLQEDWDKLRKELDDVSVWKMIKEMEAEVKKSSSHKMKETYISKVIPDIAKLEEGEDDGLAKVQLFLLGFVEVEELRDYKDPVPDLQEKCQELFDALKSAKSMEELREDECNFEMVMLATWWGWYAEQFFNYRRALKNDSPDASNLECNLDSLNYGPDGILFRSPVFTKSATDYARSFVSSMAGAETRKRKRKRDEAQAQDSSGQKQKQHRGEDESFVVASRPKKQAR